MVFTDQVQFTILKKVLFEVDGSRVHEISQEPGPAGRQMLARMHPPMGQLSEQQALQREALNPHRIPARIP